MRIREVNPLDLDLARKFMLAMLAEMASVGGHPLAEKEKVINWLGEHITSSIQDPDHQFLLAETDAPEFQPTGIVEASITQPHPVFRPKRILHIHAIYVQPDQRRQGIARGLMNAIMHWGEGRDCVEAALNTLAGNPARQLFESVGFGEFELEMRRMIG